MNSVISMLQSKTYNIILPRLDYTGPANVAIDIANAAIADGRNVNIFFLSGKPLRTDVERFTLVKKIRFFDFFHINGVIHSHGFRPDLVAWFFTWKKNCQVITTLHGHFPMHLAYDHGPRKAKLAWYVWAKALERFDCRVCISRTMMRFYRRRFGKFGLVLAYNFRRKVSITDNSSAHDFSDWTITQKQYGRTLLLYAGSLTTRKNVEALVRAVCSAPNLSLVICGQGPEYSRLEKLANDSSVGGRVLLAGHVDELQKYLEACDLLVLPSHAEGLPLVVLEAASFGVPTLMSNLAVHRELASLGFGATFGRHTFTDFEEKVMTLVNDRSDVKDEVRRLLWEKRFSPKNGFQQYAKLFGQTPAMVKE